MYLLLFLECHFGLGVEYNYGKDNTSQRVLDWGQIIRIISHCQNLYLCIRIHIERFGACFKVTLLIGPRKVETNDDIFKFLFTHDSRNTWHVIHE